LGTPTTVGREEICAGRVGAGRVPAAAATCSSVRPSSSFLLSLASSSSEENSEKYVVLPSAAFSSAIVIYAVSKRCELWLPTGGRGGLGSGSIRLTECQSRDRRFLKKHTSTVKRSLISPPRKHKARVGLGVRTLSSHDHWPSPWFIDRSQWAVGLYIAPCGANDTSRRGRRTAARPSRCPECARETCERTAVPHRSHERRCRRPRGPTRRDRLVSLRPRCSFPQCRWFF